MSCGGYNSSHPLYVLPSKPPFIISIFHLSDRVGFYDSALPGGPIQVSHLCSSKDRRAKKKEPGAWGWKVIVSNASCASHPTPSIWFCLRFLEHRWTRGAWQHLYLGCWSFYRIGTHVKPNTAGLLAVSLVHDLQSRSTASRLHSKTFQYVLFLFLLLCLQVINPFILSPILIPPVHAFISSTNKHLFYAYVPHTVLCFRGHRDKWLSLKVDLEKNQRRVEIS